MAQREVSYALLTPFLLISKSMKPFDLLGFAIYFGIDIQSKFEKIIHF